MCHQEDRRTPHPPGVRAAGPLRGHVKTGFGKPLMRVRKTASVISPASLGLCSRDTFLVSCLRRRGCEPSLYSQHGGGAQCVPLSVVRVWSLQKSSVLLLNHM